MSRTSLEVGDVVVSNEIAAAERNVAFATVHYLIRTRIEDPVDIAGAAPGAGGEDTRMHFALGFAFPDGRKYLGQDIVQKVGRPLLLGDLLRRLDPPHF